MKKIKIRFVLCKGVYHIQEKKWYGWRYINYRIVGGFGDVFYYAYYAQSTEILLTDVLNKYYKRNKDYIEITEYPLIKIY